MPTRWRPSQQNVITMAVTGWRPSLFEVRPVHQCLVRRLQHAESFGDLHAVCAFLAHMKESCALWTEVRRTPDPEKFEISGYKDDNGVFHPLDPTLELPASEGPLLVIYK